MSQIAFSHQFSKRWLSAPQQIKTAIVEELDDIICLLNDETDLNKFEFTHPDLRGHIDTIYDKLAQEKSKKLALQEQEELEKEALLAQEEAFRAAENKMRENRANKGSQSTQKHANQNADNNNSSSNVIENTAQFDSKASAINEDSQANKIAQQAYQPESVSTSNANATPIDESRIKELESRIDDYLSEQLALMSEDLKAWLRDQVNQKK